MTAQEEIAKLRKDKEILLTALEEIAEGKGRYSTDPFTHARNTIDDMKALALIAIREINK